MAGGVLPSFEDRGGGPSDWTPEGAVRTAGRPTGHADPEGRGSGEILDDTWWAGWATLVAMTAFCLL